MLHVLSIVLNSQGKELIPCDSQVWILKITDAIGESPGLLPPPTPLSHHSATLHHSILTAAHYSNLVILCPPYSQNPRRMVLG